MLPRPARGPGRRGEQCADEADRARSPGGAAIPRLGPYPREHLAWEASGPHVRDGTLEREEYECRTHIRVLGNVRVSEVTPEPLDAYRARRAGEPCLRPGSTALAGSIRAEFYTLSRALRRAMAARAAAGRPGGVHEAPAAEAAFLTDVAEHAATAAALRSSVPGPRSGRRREGA